MGRSQRFGGGSLPRVTDLILRETDKSPREDPRLATRRQKARFEALRRKRAAEPIQRSNRLRTLLDEVRWRWQLRRSLSGGRMTAAGWMIALFLCWLLFLLILLALMIVVARLH